MTNWTGRRRAALLDGPRRCASRREDAALLLGDEAPRCGRTDDDAALLLSAPAGRPSSHHQDPIAFYLQFRDPIVFYFLFRGPIAFFFYSVYGSLCVNILVINSHKPPNNAGEEKTRE
jgi:hypothetical protein